ncbi:phospholipase D-like domain-containing protein [Sulfurimonas sp.]|uniref:phospholipase D-like domain-containing protein n=1 Tax=Sulfurimonas sp. TaxID=2022749 RepID=UPI0026014A8B|nr:phospholipase D-like domain-containing protein [Sulfurimonas sp.]MDD5158059.1 phospholipase D-like domain-containing protein [Sulfurimonas sp.]
MSYLSFNITLIIITQAIVALHMLYLRRNHSAILAWLMVLMLFPYLAFAFYFVFGNRKAGQKNRKKILLPQNTLPKDAPYLNPIETVMKHHSIFATTYKNKMMLCFNGVEAFELIMDEISRAKESICIGMYIFNNDETGKIILSALRDKAAQGVDVKLLLDGVGSYWLYFNQYLLNPLKEAGAHVLFFNPILQNPFKNYLNLRNHRKIYIFDKQTVVSGGMNISKEYLGAKASKKQWIDMLFRIEGEAILPYLDIFKADFEFAGGETILTKIKNSTSPQEDLVQVVPSGPDVKSDALYEALLSAIYAATQRVWIVTPYFVPDENILKALIIARHKGIDVKLITPYDSKHWIANVARSSYMRELEENEVDIVLLSKKMLHAKAILFDEYAVMLGSVNIDNRSLFLNYEVVSFVYTKRVVIEVEQWIKKLTEGSVQKMKKASYSRRILENLMRIFSPQL